MLSKNPDQEALVLKDKLIDKLRYKLDTNATVKRVIVIKTSPFKKIEFLKMGYNEKKEIEIIIIGQNYFINIEDDKLEPIIHAISAKKVYSEERKRLVFEEPTILKEISCKNEMTKKVKNKIFEKLYNDFIEPKVPVKSSSECTLETMMKDDLIYEVKEITPKEQKNFKIFLLIRNPNKLF